jgi:hypothetical protein
MEWRKHNHLQNTCRIKKNNCSQKHKKKHIQKLFDVRCVCQAFTKANMEERNTIIRREKHKNKHVLNIFC